MKFLEYPSQAGILLVSCVEKTPSCVLHMTSTKATNFRIRFQLGL